MMMAATFLFMPPVSPVADFGICASFPQDWWSEQGACLVNTCLIAAAVAGAFFLNKRFSFVRRSEALLPASMAVILAANPINISGWGSPLLMLLINLVCLDQMMKSYHSFNATAPMFGVASWLSLGSMMEYGFLPLVAVYPLIGVMMKSFRLKEAIAYMMGLAAPYWVALGFGLVKFSDFRLPDLHMGAPEADGGLMLWIYTSLGILALLSLIAMLNNAMLIYAGNMRVRTCNNAINLLGAACFACMVADSDNFGVYVPTFCFTSAVQIANFFAMRKIPHSLSWLWSVLSLFILCFLIMLLS